MLASINPILEKSNHLFKVVKDSYSTLHLIDSDEFESSDFFFKVSLPSKENKFDIEFKPASYETIFKGSVTNLDNSAIGVYLQQWVGILADYSKPTVLDNPARYFADDFYQNMKFNNPNGDLENFKEDDIKLLQIVLERISNDVSNFVTSEPNFSVRKSLSEILDDIKDLGRIAESLPKNQVLRKFANILGKLMKNGVKYSLPIYFTLQNSFIEKIAESNINKLVTKGQELLHNLNI
jgi:hypothetical protein